MYLIQNEKKIMYLATYEVFHWKMSSRVNLLSFLMQLVSISFHACNLILWNENNWEILELLGTIEAKKFEKSAMFASKHKINFFFQIFWMKCHENKCWMLNSFLVNIDQLCEFWNSHYSSLNMYEMLGLLFLMMFQKRGEI